MHQIDWQITKGLHEMHRGMSALTSTRSTVHDELAASKALLDEEWQRELKPVMEDLYWYPFRNGISEAPESEEDLRSWLEDKYDEAAIIAILLMLLQRYSYRAYNLGGQTGLAFLGVDGIFRLENADILAEIEQFNLDLVSQGTEFSLIDTTIDDLTTQVQEARRNESGALLALAAYIALRSTQRTESIERTERPRWVGRALSDVYQRNGVHYMMYDVNGVGCPRVCAPWHGRVVPVGTSGGVIPQHPRCDCVWSPVLYDGQSVGYPPVVVSVPGLTPWQQQGVLWTGQ